jgi:DNA-binding NtrC family response regulator
MKPLKSHCCVKDWMASSSSSAAMAAAATKTIMVVDDDVGIVRIIQLGLQKAGFDVHKFVDPIVALQHLEEEQGEQQQQESCKACEVLVSDVRMPHMSGFQLVKRVKQFRPEMKVIMMTAFEVNKEEFQSINPSMQIDGLIRKPFTPAKLVEVINKVSSPPSSTIRRTTASP